MTAHFRREVLLQTAGVGSLVTLAGCTAFGTMEADVLIENTGHDEEQTEYYLDRGETTTETKTVELAPGEEYTDSVQVARGDVAVVTKGKLIAKPTLNEFVCQSPVLYVDTGFGAIGASWRCR